MKKTLLAGTTLVVILAGCAVDPYAYAAIQGYGYGAQVDASQRATYGEIYLSSGFNNDPYTVSVTSGGSVDASSVSSGCVGMVSRAPDFQLTYDAGRMPLTFGTISGNDTTLMINGPDGRWACDDDSGGDGDALVTYSSPRSGVYDVWVGAYGGNSGSAELFITELADGGGRGGNQGYRDDRDDRDNRGRGFYDNNSGARDRYSGRGTPNPGLSPNYGEIYLDVGFTPDPYRVDIYSGGSIDASDLGGSCVGMISEAPDFQVTYEAGRVPLTFGVTADGDTTLVINGPDGRWSCDDDSGGQADPEITFRRPRSGTYQVWVGAYGGDSTSGQLFITELGR